jgi:hypothetical protein
MASLVSLHAEVARIHDADVLANARRGQLLSLANEGRTSLLSRVRDHLAAHRPPRFSGSRSEPVSSPA